MKHILILLGLLVATYCLTYSQLNSCDVKCSSGQSSDFNDNCLFDPNNSGTSYPKDINCALSVQKRNLCMGSYGCRMGDQSNDTVPFICWKCVTSSPNIGNSEYYSSYKSCMQDMCKTSYEEIE